MRRTGAGLIALCGVLIASPAWADRFEDLLEEAKKSTAAGNREEAIALCDQVITASSAPSGTVTHCRYLQGRAQSALGRHDEAIVSLRMVIRAEPKNYDFSSSYRRLNESYGATGLHEEGVHLANLTSESYPRAHEPILWRAEHFTALGLYEEAIAEIERFLRSETEPDRISRGIGVLLMSHLLQGDIQAARDTLSRKPSGSGAGDFMTLEVRGPALIDMIGGNPEKAREIMEGGAVLGVWARPITEDEAKKKKVKKKERKNLMVADIQPDSSAARAGIMIGDLILSYGGSDVKTGNQFQRMIWNSEPGTKVDLVLRRDRKKQTLTVIPVRSRFDEGIFREGSILERYWRTKDVKAEAKELWATGRRRDALQLYADFASEMMPDPETIGEIAGFVRQLNPPPAVPEEAITLAREGEMFSLAALGREDVKPAIERYREAVKLAPWWSDAHLNLGLLYERRGDFILAANSLRNSLTLAGNSPDARAIEARLFELEFRAQRAR